LRLPFGRPKAASVSSWVSKSVREITPPKSNIMPLGTLDVLVL